MSWLRPRYMRFYANKAQEVADLEDGFKKRYMLSAFRLMMKSHGENFDFEADEAMMAAHLRAAV